MSNRGPDFDELVGSDVDSSERERLLRVHDALVQAGPPPELSLRLDAAPSPAVRPLRSRRRRATVVALAAAFGAIAFAIGYLVAGVGGPSTDRVIAMTGAGGASASIVVFEIDDAGNWPMELEVEGLEPPASGGRYQLWLTRDGELAALCGSFLVESEGTTVVPMNAPWRFDEFDGWVVVEAGSKTPVLTT
ncbi:MAG: anti-sigma factor [Actinomycetota bacterium]|nr:anti-sigma factor [Actinomycetota bacterium]